jgi:hypothetical protein
VSRVDRLDHAIYHAGQGLPLYLVFPHPDHVPAVIGQGARVALVARTISVDLGQPPIPVPTRGAKMEGAPVPEAAVDEDADLGAGEHEVSDATKRGDRPAVLEEAEPAPMECATEGHFRCRVGPLGRPHYRSGVGVACWRRWLRAAVCHAGPERVTRGRARQVRVWHILGRQPLPLNSEDVESPIRSV